MFWASFARVRSEYGQGTVTVKKCAHTVSVVFALSHSLMNPLRTIQNDRQTVPMHLNDLIELFKHFFCTQFQKNQSKKTRTKNQKKHSDNELLKMLQNHEGDCLFPHFCLLNAIFRLSWNNDDYLPIPCCMLHCHLLNVKVIVIICDASSASGHQDKLDFFSYIRRGKTQGQCLLQPQIKLQRFHPDRWV